MFMAPAASSIKSRPIRRPAVDTRAPTRTRQRDRRCLNSNSFNAPKFSFARLSLLAKWSWGTRASSFSEGNSEEALSTRCLAAARDRSSLAISCFWRSRLLAAATRA